MNALPVWNTPGLTVRITYTAYNFEHCRHTIVEYTNDLIIQNRMVGTEINRKIVNLAFEANVKEIYAEGSAMRQELLEQVRRGFSYIFFSNSPYGFSLPTSCTLFIDILRHCSRVPGTDSFVAQINCPSISNYWEKRLRPAAYLVYMRDDTTPYGILPRSSNDIARSISAILEDDNTRIELPYLGLRNLRQLRYMDIVSKVRISRLGRDAGGAPRTTMSHVWKTVVMNMFWFEDSKLKEEKLAEVCSIFLVLPADR